MSGTIIEVPINMKILMGFFLLSAATSLHAAEVDSLDEVFYMRAQTTLVNEEGVSQNYFFDEDEHQLWREKMKIKGSWRWSLDEWEDLLRGTFDIPEYYYDEELKASNGGYCIA